ncbi:MAG TPA: hypothetical protein VH593_28685, partial [Ktedonobacteraceae bacterium]
MIPCGCNRQGPGSVCERGKKLFTAVTQALQALIDGTAVRAGDERWAAYTYALLTYIDHLRGWREGDVKVQRSMGAWMLFVRSHGQWVFHVGTEDERLVREWLLVRGYQQFVERGINNPLSGYYRKEGDVHASAGRQMMTSLPSGVSLSGVVVSRNDAGGQEAPALLPSSSLTLQTQVAISIALLIARIPRIPSPQ